MSRQPTTMRARTAVGGVALGAVLLVALGLAGGAAEPVTRSDQPEPPRPGPQSVRQPELRRALLTGEELARISPIAPSTISPAATTPVPAPTAAVTAPTTGPAASEPPPPSEQPGQPGLPGQPGQPGRPGQPGQPGQPERSRLAELCRALFEDPASLPARWGMSPRETAATLTRPRTGGVLRQVLTVFQPGDAVEAYARLRQTAAGCERFRASLADGTVVTVLVEALAPRPEPDSPVRADEAYAVRMRIEGPRLTRTGWLVLDRLGPVVSVLRHLAPPGSAPGDPGPARRAALGKLRSLLPTPPAGGR